MRPHEPQTGKLQGIASEGCEEVCRAYLAAKDHWRGCDWTTSFGGLSLDLNGITSQQACIAAAALRGQESEAWLAAANWLRDVEMDSRKASSLAAAAAIQFCSGQRQVALVNAEFAMRLEAKYRSPKVWQELLNLIASQAVNF